MVSIIFIFYSLFMYCKCLKNDIFGFIIFILVIFELKILKGFPSIADNPYIIDEGK